MDSTCRVCAWCCTEHLLTSSGGSWECAIFLHFCLFIAMINCGCMWPETEVAWGGPWILTQHICQSILDSSLPGEECLTFCWAVFLHWRWWGSTGDRKGPGSCWSASFVPVGELCMELSSSTLMSAVEPPVVEPGPNDLLCPYRELLWGQHESELTISRGIDKTDLFLWLGDVLLLRTLPC